MTRTLALLLVGSALGLAHAQEKAPPKSQTEIAYPIPLDKTDKVATKAGKWNEPNPISSDTDLTKLVGDATTRKKILDAVDFKTHVLLIFSWSGSGKDIVEAKIVEETPKEVRFSLSPGATDDLREHVQMFAVKKETRWTAK